MHNAIVSLIRTLVPVAVGSLIAWLVTVGIEVNAEAQAGLVTGLTGVIIAAYYTLARLLERKWPWIGVLLGSTAQPVYRDARVDAEPTQPLPNAHDPYGHDRA